MSIHTIYLYEAIGEWSETASPRGLLREFKAAKDAGCKEVQLRIHSPGGNVFSGWAMYNFIQAQRKEGTKVSCYIDGVAASMATFIMLACDKVECATNAMLMCHQASGYAEGSADDFEQGAKLLKSINDIARKEYQKRGVSAELVDRWLANGDHWLKPQEAYDCKLIDDIYDAPMSLADDVQTNRAKMERRNHRCWLRLRSCRWH
jgi:ATP-dependent protease ClpP protease subunit